jgi:hypothetical protein
MNELNDLNKLRVDLREKINNLRNIEHFLRQVYFENLWTVSDEEQTNALKTILEKKDKFRLINWIRRHPSILLGEKSIRQLRDDARELYISGYSRMNKGELLMALKNYKKDPLKPSELTTREMILEINRLIDEMAPLFEEAKIRENYLFVDPEAINFDLKVITEAFNWIQKIHDREYQKAKEIKMLLPEETWIRYKSWGADFADHREVILLNEALQKLRKVIVSSTRPDLFKNSKVKSFLKKLMKKEKE